MNVLIKDFYRTIFRNFTKFFSIILLTVLGVMVFVGLRITSPIMKDSVEYKTLRDNLYHYKVTSTFGFLEKDVEIIENLGENFEYEFGYGINLTDEIKKIDFRVENNPKKISKVHIIEGFLPKNIGEIAIDSRLDDKYKIGDEIIFKDTEKTLIFNDEIKKLNRNSFKVVGFFESSEIGYRELNESVEMGYFAVINRNDFDFTNYNFVKIVYKPLLDIPFNSKSYFNEKNKLREILNNSFKSRPFEVYNIVYSQKKAKLDEGKAEIDEKKNDLLTVTQKIDDSIENLRIGKNDVRIAYSNLYYERDKFEEKMRENISNLNAKLTETRKKEEVLDLELQTLTKIRLNSITKRNDVEREINGLKVLIYEKNNELTKLRDDYVNSKISLEEYENSKNEIENYISKAESDIRDKEKLYEKSKEEIESLSLQIKEVEKNLNPLKDAKEELTKSLSTLNAEYERGKSVFYSQEQRIIAFENRLKSGEVEIKDGKEKIEDGKKKIQEGEEKLKDANELISKILDPQYIIEDGLITSSSSTVLKSADGIIGLSNVFSIFFFFIAILVSLTTITRMVDENRIQIGTLKALGYTNFEISKKYIYYGFIASVIGGMLGVILGLKVISPVVFNAYLTPFRFEKIDNFNYKNILFIGVLIAVFTITISAYISCNKSLKEKIAALMRAKVPKAGNKTLIEEVKFLWREFSFLFKVTIRNIFRYKIRLAITIFGITGCMALLVLGFGIKDSINGVVNNQYEKYSHFQLIVNYNTMDLEKNIEAFKESLLKNEKIDSIYDLTLLRGELKTDVEMDNVVSIYTVDNYTDFKKFYSIYENGKVVEELKDGLYVNEKIADKLKLNVGNVISFYENNELHEHTISGIFENHIGNSIIMNANTHEKIFSKRQVKNSKLIKLKDPTDENIKIVSQEIKNNSVAIRVFDSTSSKNALNNLSKSIDIVVIVMITCSAFLSMVVLYNLSNINITERKREVATLKVLGFYPKEVSSYIYRETFILSIFGTVFGIIVGNILHKNIIGQLSADNIKFFSKISLHSYIYSALLTQFFILIIYIVVKVILGKINMIESLKDVE